MENKSGAQEYRGKPIICKAAICRKAGEPLVIEEIQVDPPKAWEVRIKILCSSLCHSDVTFWKMDRGPAAKFPRILGHEAVGVVESVGEHVEEVKEGDLVVPVFLSHCGECRDCKSTRSNTCSMSGNQLSKDMPRDESSRFRDMKGEVLHHSFRVSSFTEYTVVDVIHVVKITHDMPLDKACLLSCGVSTGLGAVWKVADVDQGSTVAIFGLGAVGLAVAVGAKQRGASKIIGVDLNPEKFEIGKKFGVSDFVNPATCKEKPVSEVIVLGFFSCMLQLEHNDLINVYLIGDQVIKEMTNGGADYCFECIGLASLMADAFNCTREGWGKTVILGVEMHGSPMTLSPYHLLRGRTIMGSLFGGLKPKSDVPFLANKYLDKELCLDDFISHEVGFKDINKAFDYLIGGNGLRCIIWMDK